MLYNLYIYNIYTKNEDYNIQFFFCSCLCLDIFNAVRLSNAKILLAIFPSVNKGAVRFLYLLMMPHVLYYTTSYTMLCTGNVLVLFLPIYIFVYMYIFFHAEYVPTQLNLLVSNQTKNVISSSFFCLMVEVWEEILCAV